LTWYVVFLYSFSEPLTYIDCKIICNSVAQYFPSLQYLHDLVDCAASHLNEGGCLFMGDMRNHLQQRQFAAAVSLCKEPTSVAALSLDIVNTIQNDKELLVLPDYFIQLARKDKRFGAATAFLRRGTANTEMNLFR
jgi:hypothetical protein